MIPHPLNYGKQAIHILKSPGGSIFPYPYQGGEIHCLKYGSFFSKSQQLYGLMDAEEAFIKKSNQRLRIWVDFYETDKNDDVLLRFAMNLSNLFQYITKLAIVGFSSSDRRRFQKTIKNSLLQIPQPIEFFTDPEEAKTWLVGE